jgi:hypothetical protein
MKTDIEILREMFKESAIEPLEKQNSQRDQLILSEPGLDYKVTIRGMPEEYEASPSKAINSHLQEQFSKAKMENVKGQTMRS